MHELRIEPRFCGPPGTANGGYVAGLLAARLPHAACVTVRLNAAVPLGTPLHVAPDEHGADRDAVVLLHGSERVAQATPGALDLEWPSSGPSFERAQAVRGTCRAFVSHPFPGCFVCGPDRDPHDGLGIFPGVHENGFVAAPWTPDPALCAASGAVAPEYLWAALDCASSFALLEPPEAERLVPMVLGTLAAELRGTLQGGEPAVVLSWPLAYEGRRAIGATAIFGASGACVGLSRAVWVSLAGRSRSPE